MAKWIGWQFVVLAPFVMLGAGKALAPAPSVKAADVLHATHARQSDGADIYAKHCVSCHGKEGKGDGPAAAALNPAPPDLTDTERMEALSDDQLLKVLSDGKGFMPGYATMLKAEELKALATYVRSLSAGDAAGR